MKKINIGLLGFGNVGSGTYETLYMNKEHIEKKSDIDISVSKILVRNLEKYKTSKVPFELFTDNPDDILEDENIDIGSAGRRRTCNIIHDQSCRKRQTRGHRQ